MTEGTSKAPAWYTVAVALLILWGLMGCVSLYLHFGLGPDYYPDVTDYDRRLYATIPLWHSAVYFVAVLSGLGGAIALVARRQIALLLSALSVVAVVIQFAWTFLATDMIAVKGVWVTYFPAFILAVQLFQLWLSRRAQRAGLLR